MQQHPELCINGQCWTFVKLFAVSVSVFEEVTESIWQWLPVVKAGEKQCRNHSRASAREHVTSKISDLASGCPILSLKALTSKGGRKGKRQTHSGLRWFLLEYPTPCPESHKWQSWRPCKYILKPCRQVSIKTTDESNHRHAYISGSMPRKLPQMFWIASWSLEVLIFSGHLLSTYISIICCFVLIASSLDFEKYFLCREIYCCSCDQKKSSSMGLSQSCNYFFFF